jgi:hypothetical protein
MTPTFLNHTAMSAVMGAACTLAIFVSPARAVINFEEPERITDAFMAACTQHQTESSCSCAMGRIIDRITFVSFADAVDEGRADLVADREYGPMTSAALESCARGQPIEKVEARPAE